MKIKITLMKWKLTKNCMTFFDQISPSQTNCPFEEYINGEDDVPTYMQYDDDWEDHFFDEIGFSQADLYSLVQEDPENEGQFDLKPPPPKITRFQDAISSPEAVQCFFDNKGYSEEATTVASSMNRLTYLHCESLNSARQTTLDKWRKLNLFSCRKCFCPF